MSEWITDRKPTEFETSSEKVWAVNKFGDISMVYYKIVEIGMPWQPILKPAPYVKPKKWTVEWYDPNNCWHVVDTTIDGVMGYLHLDITHADAAQRIADIYNEVMP